MSMQKSKAELLRRVEKMIAFAEAYGEKRRGRMLAHAYLQWLEHDNAEFMVALRHMKWMPVTIDEFVESPEFLAAGTGDPIMDIWPTLMDDIRAMNPDVVVGEAPVFECLLGGATGTGKTTLCHATNLYQGYLATCYRDVQRLYGLTTATPIIFMFQSVSQTITKRVIYQPFRQMFTRMEYVRKYVPFRKDKETTLDIEGNISIVPALAGVENMVGQAIMSGMVDEANFMSVVENSKRAVGARGGGGHFDQAEDTVRNITRRRARSFTTTGVSIGAICVLSSTRYKNDFMDRRLREVVEFEEEGVFTFRKKQYEANPKYVVKEGTKTFRLLVGSDRYPTRILREDEVAGEHYPENAQVEIVPEHYRTRFQQDPDGALRDVIGVATDTISGFMQRRDKIVEAVIEGGRIGLQSWAVNPDVDRSEGDAMPQWDEELMPPRSQRKAPRWVHIDLSRTKDRCGIAIIRPLGIVAQSDAAGVVEHVPSFAVETVLTIKPSPQFPIDPGEIRRFVMQLVTFYGFEIAEVTYDGFDSRESQMALAKAGVGTRQISMDITTEPMEYMRRAFYEDRVAMVDHEIVRVELSNLEYHAEKNKVDHPPKGTKDAADAVCGAIFACSTSRHLRGAVGFTSDDGKAPERVRERPQGRERS